MLSTVPTALLFQFQNKLKLYHRQARRASVFPRPQNWIHRFLNDRIVDHLGKENFRGSRGTFEFTFKLVEPIMEGQNNRMREATTVDKRVAVRLWCFAIRR